ncbi:MAG: UDP-3-O-(3-hydroxymyristoyl)glucosamine N-acyltransferase, partial [Rhodospirillales bacterium]|nr:UDP-3-O-(3-hydroxymyristoyl)glucosamine N-acyltransferase [Rhodospirillales bacterium]
MADTRFFDRAGPFDLEVLAEAAGAKIGGLPQSKSQYFDVRPLQTAGAEEVSFIDNRKYLDEFRTSNAGAILLRPDLTDQAPSGAALLITDDPYGAYAVIAQMYYPREAHAASTNLIDACADSAEIGAGVNFQRGSVVGENCKIGSGSIIGANAVIARGVYIGDNCSIGANSTLSHCTIGNNVIIHPGAAIGQDGFGFAPGHPEHKKVPQLGSVIIEDNVEIGSNTAIDRGSGPDTIIRSGTKIDNLCQIGHNVE